MSYIAERREEEKERRRAEIVDAAERLYSEKGWETVTVEQVARTARLSRALVYVYFRDKEELLFAIGERAMFVLRERFVAAAARHVLGMDKVEAIGRAYMQYALDFPHYFDVCARFQAHSMAAVPGSNEGACATAGDYAIGEVVKAIVTGMEDGSISADIGPPMMLAISLWGFTHGIIQVAMAKGKELERFGIETPALGDYAFAMLRRMAQARVAT